MNSDNYFLNKYQQEKNIFELDLLILLTDLNIETTLLN